MKRICSALCAVLMLLSLVGCNAYSDELTFFESEAVNWDMTMLDAYRYIEGDMFTKEEPAVESTDDGLIVVSNLLYRFCFNTEGRLLTIVYDLGQSAETASVITQKWFGECDEENGDVRYWYRSLADVDTNVELHEEDGAYRLDFVLMDEKKKNAVHIDLEDLFNEAIAMLDNEDVDGALDVYDLILKAGYAKADKLKKHINEVRMAQYFDKGDYETAWDYCYGVDVMNPDMYKECAYQLAVSAFDTASLDAMEQAVAMMKEHCYLYKNTADYETYLNARKQEVTDVLAAKTLYDTLPLDFLDVADRLDNIIASLLRG